MQKTFSIDQYGRIAVVVLRRNQVRPDPLMNRPFILFMTINRNVRLVIGSQCGMGPVIAEDCKGKVIKLSGIDEANVEIVWDPPWTQDLISETGKMELGLI